MHHEQWTAAQTETTVSVDGHDLEVAYYENGTENPGPPIVFLHGIPTWSYLWREIAPALAEERHVVAPDLLGYGNSAMDDGFDRSIRAQEAMLSALLDALAADRVDLVAHDIGGGVALRLAAHQSERVRRLVLSNATCYDSWPVEFIHGLGLPGKPEEFADDDKLAETLAFAFDGGLYDDEGHEEFREGMRAPWQSAEGRTSLVRNAVATNTNHTTELAYQEITADLLLLWGEDDVLQPIDYAERLQDDVTGDPTLEPIADAYHWVVEDRPDVYLDHLEDFLVDG